MRIGEPESGRTVESAAADVHRIRQFAPFKYSGRWYVGVDLKGQGFAYRNKADLVRAISKGRTAGEPISIALVE